MKVLSKETRICALCNNVEPFNSDRKGKFADNKKWMFILNAADKRVLHPTLFGEDYDTALGKTHTGKILGQFFKYSTISIEDIYLTNAYKCLPVTPKGKDRKPKKKEYQNCSNILRFQIQEFAPKKIIVFGEPAYETLFSNQQEVKPFDEAIKSIENAYNGIPICAMNHPGEIWWNDRTAKEAKFGIMKFFLKNK